MIIGIMFFGVFLLLIAAVAIGLFIGGAFIMSAGITKWRGRAFRAPMIVLSALMIAGGLVMMYPIIQYGSFVSGNIYDDWYLKNGFKKTLEYAVSDNNLEDVERLLKTGADPNRYRYTPPLKRAVSNGNPQITELLLQYGANIPHDALYYACYGETLDIAEVLLEYGANVNERISYNNDTYNEGCTALFNAVRNNEFGIELAALLLEHGADVHAVNDRGETALFWAANNNSDYAGVWECADKDLQKVKMLVAYGANVNHINNNGQTILDMSRDWDYRARKDETIDYLISIGAKYSNELR
ncbi:MAG: ankyrin repeat domain-containing protein [Oscillospiraceae bacterium]|nr:ankyrin repeat domain-containing protein [Oscillospiraceae bacterium]